MNMLNAYLTFDGNAAEAMRFYEQALDAKLEMLLTVGQSPMGAQAPPDMADRVMHARLAVNGTFIMASDNMRPTYDGMKGFSLTLSYATAEEATRRFNALSEGAAVTMPLQKTFWAEVSAILTDRFGTPWIINGNLYPVEPHSQT